MSSKILSTLVIMYLLSPLCPRAIPQNPSAGHMDWGTQGLFNVEIQEHLHFPTIPIHTHTLVHRIGYPYH